MKITKELLKEIIEEETQEVLKEFLGLGPSGPPPQRGKFFADFNKLRGELDQILPAKFSDDGKTYSSTPEWHVANKLISMIDSLAVYAFEAIEKK